MPKKADPGDRRLKLTYGLKGHERLEGDYVRGWKYGKSAFLDDARKFLKDLIKYMDWVEDPQNRIKISAGGPAVSGEVCGCIFPSNAHPEGVFIMLPGYPIPGDRPDPDPNRQVCIMYRRCTREDWYGSRFPNNWLHGDVTVRELAERVRKVLGSL